MDDEIGNLQPWQIFSGLYIVFWAFSAYFDHFVMTFVFCIAFGVISEIVAKYMNGVYHKKNEDVSSLMSMARSEATLVPSLTAMAKQEASAVTKPLDADNVDPTSSNDVWEKCEAFQDDEVLEPVEVAEDQDEDECPPPLPAKDYLKSTEETIDAVKNRLSQVMEASLTMDSDSDIDKFESQPVADDLSEALQLHGQTDDFELDDDDVNEAAGISDLNESTGKLMAGQHVDEPTIDMQDDQLMHHSNANGEVLKHVSEGHCPVISQIEQQDSAVTENIRSMSEINNAASGSSNFDEFKVDSASNSDKLKQEKLEDLGSVGAKNLLEKQINLFSTRVQDDDSENDILDTKDALAADVINCNLPTTGGTNTTKDERIYAPDSSSDDELEEEYAKREVNLDESESEEDDDSYEYKSGRELSAASAPANVVTALTTDQKTDDMKSDSLLVGASSGDIEQIGQIANDPPVVVTGAAAGELDLDLGELADRGAAKTTDSIGSSSSAAAAGGATGVKAMLEAADKSSSHSKNDEEEIDIDLTDPQLELAATKIQSVFKGFKARKKMNRV